MKRLNIHGSKSARISAWAALGLAVLGLAGCSNRDITALKAETLTDHPSFTIGQAFDHRNACKSVSWSEDTDHRGRQIVTYRCHFKVDPTIYTRLRQRQIKELTEGAAQIRKLHPGATQWVAHLQAKINKLKNTGTIVGGTEVFQWVKTGEGFSSIYAGRSIQRSDGTIQSFRYDDLQIAVNAIVSNKASDLSTYANETDYAIARSL